MEARERIALALEGREPLDRPPVTAWGHDFRAEWRPDALAASTAANARRFGWDLVKLQPRASCFAEAFGADYRPSGSAAEGPRLLRSVIGGAADWARLETAEADCAPLADQVEALRALVDELAGERAVYQTVFSPFTVASYLAADERAEARRRRPDLIAKDQARALRHLAREPASLASGLKAITATLVAFVERSIAAGADGIFYAIGGSASREALDPGAYARLLLPHDREVLAAVPTGVPVILHLCGANLAFELVRELPSRAVSWATALPGNPTLAEGRALANRAVVGGVAEVDDLVAGTPASVAASVRAAIAETGGHRLVVAPGCSVPPAASAANLEAMVPAAIKEPV